MPNSREVTDPTSVINSVGIYLYHYSYDQYVPKCINMCKLF